MNNELVHHGIKGMKWGVRRTPAQLSRASSSSKGSTKSSTPDKSKTNVSKPSASSAKKISDMTDDELRTTINRLNLERQYKDLTKLPSSASKNKGKEFVMDVLEKSGKTVLTQASTYYMGKMVNSIAGTTVIPSSSKKNHK